MKDGSTRVVQLRPELEHSRQTHQGKTYLIVKDPVTQRYFRFTASQAILLEILKTPVDAATLAGLASEKRGAPLSVETAEAFLESLADKFLLDTPEVREKLASIKGRQLREPNLLYRKLASLNAEKIFEWLLPRTRWAFTRWFQYFAVTSIVFGLAIAWLHWDRLIGSAPSLLTLRGLLLIWPVIFVVITIHEFSHGLTCRHFGGKVHEVGFMLIYFQPAFYCDVSDSYMFESKRNRMLVTLAGGYVQLVLWGLCAGVWRVTEPGTAINQVTLIVMVFGGLQTLVNFNPLIKLDGYYMLSDYLEIPNLRAKAFKSLWEWVSKRQNPPVPFREQRPLLIYGMASIVFSTSLLVYVYASLYTWVTSNYALAGLVAFAMFSGLTLRKTAAESMAGVRALAVRASYRKYRNLLAAAALLLVSFVAHWELKITADFRILARQDAVVWAETGGVIAEVPVREGDWVEAGAVVARLRWDFVKQERFLQVGGDLDKARSELNRLYYGARQEELDPLIRQLTTKEAEVVKARSDRDYEMRLLKEDLEQERAALEFDQIQLRRVRQGVEDEVFARIELDRAESAVRVRESTIAGLDEKIRAAEDAGNRAVDVASNAADQVRSELALMRNIANPEVIRQQEILVEQLQSQYENLAAERATTEMRAPIAGVVLTPFVERKVGESVIAGAELMRIADTERVTVEMLVPEREMADVESGSTVWMKVDSFPTRDFQGRVDFIAPIAQTAADGRQMVVVRSFLLNEDRLLKPEMTGVGKISGGEYRIAELVTRRLRLWIGTEFWPLLP